MGETPTKLDQVPNGCWMACIAGLSGIPHETLTALIPPGVDFDAKATELHNAVNAITRANGWRLAYIGPDVPRGYAMAYGTSPRELHHAVIVKDGVLWHDPHPSRAGLRSVDAYEVLIPLVAPAPDAVRFLELSRACVECRDSGWMERAGQFVPCHCGRAPTTEKPDDL